MIISVVLFLGLLTFASSERGNKNAASHKFSIGSIQGVIISNGPSVTNVQPFSAPDRVVFREYKKCFRSSSPFVFGQNVVVLDMPNGKRVMIDTGAKPNPIFPFWAKTGKMLPNLIAAGIQPESIDAVLLTHGHADHVNGLLGEGGEAAFPNAAVYIGKTEHAFWTASTPAPDAMLEPNVFAALANEYSKSISPYQAKSSFNVVSNTASPVSGIRFFPTPGHTPGHNSIKVQVGDDVLILAADAWVSKPDQVRHPTWSFSFDTHPKQAIRSRKKLLKMVAKKQYPVIAFHEAFPGLGYITPSHRKYDWIAAPIESHGLGVSRDC